jgi:predicted AAA+ superfamily ATPase
MRQLHPWFEDLGKQQVHVPKVYVRDTGPLHVLLGLSVSLHNSSTPTFHHPPAPLNFLTFP